MAISCDYPYGSITPERTHWQWPSNGTGFTYSWPSRLTDQEIDAIADRIIAKLEERGFEIVQATRSEEV